jgi:hypothetical protein
MGDTYGPPNPADDPAMQPDPAAVTSNAQPPEVAAIAQGGQPAAPQPAQAQPSSNPMTQAMVSGANDATAQTPDQKTHGWRAVLQGALSGLENHLKGAGEGFVTHGALGAVAGAVNPNFAKGQYDTAIGMQKAELAKAQKIPQFMDAQAASMYADAHLRDAQRANMDRDYQLEVDKLGLDQFKSLIQAGFYPTAVTGNSQESVVAGMNSIAEANGGKLPGQILVHLGDGFAAFNPADVSSSQYGMQMFNKYAKVAGMPQAQSIIALKKVPPKVMQSAMSLFDPPATAGGQQNDTIERYQNYLNAAKRLPDSDPDKAELVRELPKTIERLQNSHANTVKENKDLASARAQTNADQRVIPVAVPDGKGGVTQTYQRAKNAVGMTPSSEADKNLPKFGQLQDIMQGSQNLRQDVQNAKPFSTQDVAQVSAAIRSGDLGTVRATLDSVNRAAMDPATKQVFVDLLQMHERALSIRGAAGQGNSSSDKQRDAVFALLPQAQDLPDKQLFLKKLDRFDQQVQIFHKNVPKVAGVDTSLTPPAEQNPAPAAGGDAQFSKISASGKYGWNGSHWVERTQKGN